MKKLFILFVLGICITADVFAQRNSNRLMIGSGLMYKNGWELTLGYEHEMNYRHCWEFFVNGYLQWKDCPSCGHVCPQSFWNNYRTWGVGAAYKPCVIRRRNHYGSLRLGASGGSDTDKFVAGIHLGYEHNYVMRSGWTFYWQVRNDIMINGKDLFRTGFAIGVKLPLN